jgi:thiol-disulfide isomerase/thioredoxin
MKTLLPVLALSLLVVTLPARAAVDDAAIDQAAKEYKRLFEESREAGNRPGMGDMGDYVDQAFAQIAIEELTLDQIDRMLDAAPVSVSTRTAVRVNDALKKQAEKPDVDGARAALLQLKSQSRIAKSAEKLPKLQAALSHPAIAQAVEKGYGSEIFVTAMELDDNDLQTVTVQLVALKDSIRPDASPKFFTNGAAFLIRVVEPENPEPAKALAPLRESLSAALATKLKGDVAEKDKPRLEEAEARLNGAFARGELIGHPAPNIDFSWFRDPAKPDVKVASLADLKGKVVVLDFWATWCGPCIASFPNVKALHNYYRGYDVAVIGVTSIQGSHSGPGGRVDTKGDPDKEMSLMPEFMDQKTMTWPVAFSKQNVFNPDYGVMGIPNMVMIDPKGIVRYAGMHPGSKLDEKTALIDKLLSEAKLTIPAALLMPKKQD